MKQNILRPAAPLLSSLRLTMVILLTSSATVLTAEVDTTGGRLLTAGDTERLWIAKPGTEAGTFILLHREVDQTAPGITPIMPATKGLLLPGGLSASNRQLWLAYKPISQSEAITVRSIRIPTTPTTTTTALIKPTWSIQPSLPKGTTLRSWAAADGNLWALVRAPKRPEISPNVIYNAASSSLPTKDTPDTPAQADVDPIANTTAPSTSTNESKPSSIGTAPSSRHDQLLHLNRRTWKQVALPAGWAQDAHVWLVMRRASDPFPHLLSLYVTEQGTDLWVYHNENNQWARNVYPLHPTESADAAGAAPSAGANPATIVPMAVDGQIVIGEVVKQPNEVSVDVSVLRQGSTIQLGRLQVKDQAIKAWDLVPFGKTVTLITNNDQGALKWSRLDLQGQHIEQATELHQSITIPLADAANWIVHTAVLVLATILMFASWRRDPSWHRLNLPEGVTLAQISQRLMAGAIDLSPCLLIVILVYDIEPLTLFNKHWPGRSGNWEEMIPGTVVIGLFILHTLIGELLFGQTVGKRIFGLRVTSLNGERPAAWQILLRCITKAFDLIAQLLLILPLVGPYRQRLGDLIARTVVLTPEPKPVKDDTKA